MNRHSPRTTAQRRAHRRYVRTSWPYISCEFKIVRCRTVLGSRLRASEMPIGSGGEHSKNEVLGLPSTLGDHICHSGRARSCCGMSPCCNTVITKDSALALHCSRASTGEAVPIHEQSWSLAGCTPISFLRSGKFWQPVREEPDMVLKHIACICNYYQVSAIVADGNGNGHVYNRLLLGMVQPRYGPYAIYYSSGEQEPIPDGALTRWTVNRSASIGAVFGRIKRKQLIFPRRQDADIFLDEFACESAVYDDHNGRSTSIPTLSRMTPYTPRTMRL